METGMAKALSTPETACDQIVVLRNLDWEIYERIVAAHLNSSVPRFTYDRGDLEIMSPSPEHEKLKEFVTLLVNVWAEELGIDLMALGSTTFRRKDLRQGFEPDSCFYIQSIERIRGKIRLDLTTDPPPDLLIEIDVTSPSIDKLPIYAQIGVPEVWRYDGQRLIVLKLESLTYLEQETSEALDGLTAAIVTRFLQSAASLRRPEWLRQLRACARQR
jgi:Uma2 family endonuclease